MHFSDLPEGVSQCPTCGRFVSNEEGYFDLPPGGHWAVDFITPYCNEVCARNKPEPCIHETDE